MKKYEFGHMFPRVAVGAAFPRPSLSLTREVPTEREAEGEIRIVQRNGLRRFVSPPVTACAAPATSPEGAFLQAAARGRKSPRAVREAGPYDITAESAGFRHNTPAHA